MTLEGQIKVSDTLVARILEMVHPRHTVTINHV